VRGALVPPAPDVELLEALQDRLGAHRVALGTAAANPTPLWRRQCRQASVSLTASPELASACRADAGCANHPGYFGRCDRRTQRHSALHPGTAA
jgi:hypothetical protein